MEEQFDPSKDQVSVESKGKKGKKFTKWWGIVFVLVLTGLTFVLMNAFALLGWQVADRSRLDAYVLSEMFGEVGLGLGVLASMTVHRCVTGKRVRDAVKFKGFSFLLLIAITLASWSTSEICSHVMGVLLYKHVYITPDKASVVGIISIIGAVVCAPIFEELIFRFSFIGLLKKNSGMIFTIGFTSLIFSMMHLYNAQNTLNVFAGTVFVAYIYYKTENILYAIGEHAIHNAMCLLPFSEFRFFGVEYDYVRNGFSLLGWPWICIYVIVLGISMIWIILYFKKRSKRVQ